MTPGAEQQQLDVTEWLVAAHCANPIAADLGDSLSHLKGINFKSASPMRLLFSSREFRHPMRRICLLRLYRPLAGGRRRSRGRGRGRSRIRGR